MNKFIIAFLVVVLDQLSKFIFSGKHYGIINYTTNTGMVFGLFKGYNFLFILITLIIVLFIGYILLKDGRLSYSFILGGAIGNLMDRLVFGFVRDFIDLKIWPVFNLADSFIVIGILFVIWEEFFKKKDL